VDRRGAEVQAVDAGTGELAQRRVGAAIEAVLLAVEQDAT